MGHHQEKPPTTVGQFVVALVGSLLMPLVVIFLIVQLVMGIQNRHKVDTDPKVAEAAVLKRIAPVGDVSLKDTSGPAVAKSGEQVVNEICIACHGVGALGSPKIGDAGAWGPRIAQGYDTLVLHATKGIRAMPARGGNADLSDIEVASAVAYMANKSGASFKAPKPAGPAAAPAAEAKPAAPAGK